MTSMRSKDVHMTVWELRHAQIMGAILAERLSEFLPAKAADCSRSLWEVARNA
jgi:hypothetical protein